MHGELLPIRVDVFSPDKSLRIVDTILLDPQVWAIPLNYQSSQTLEETLQANCVFWADALLADAEVAGLGRTVRHFMGRLELWSRAMLQELQQALYPQFYAVVQHHLAVSSSTTGPPRALAPRLDQEEINDAITRESKRIRVEEGVAAIQAHSSHQSALPPSLPGKKGSSIMTEREETHQQFLVPIHIRMSIHGIRIHDDLQIDPYLQHKVNPLVLAQTLGADLLLPDEAVQAVAVDVAEQLGGSQILVDETPMGPSTVEPPKEALSSSSALNLMNPSIPSSSSIKSSVPTTNPQPTYETDEGGPSDRRYLTGAWTLDQRVFVTNVAHLVAHHRPSETTASRTTTSSAATTLSSTK